MKKFKVLNTIPLLLLVGFLLGSINVALATETTTEAPANTESADDKSKATDGKEKPADGEKKKEEPDCD